MEMDDQWTDGDDDHYQGLYEHWHAIPRRKGVQRHAQVYSGYRVYGYVVGGVDPDVMVDGAEVGDDDGGHGDDSQR